MFCGHRGKKLPIFEFVLDFQSTVFIVVLLLKMLSDRLGEAFAVGPDVPFWRSKNVLV